MAITREKKEEVVREVTEVLSSAPTTVFVGFHGLSVGDLAEMRSALKAQGVRYRVAKKSLIARALDAQKSVEGERPALDGEVALAFGDDMLAPAREVQTFVKKHKEGLSILGGIFDGAYMSAAEMTEIASIPPRETLLAQFVNLINSPLQQTAVVLDQIAQKKEA